MTSAAVSAAVDGTTGKDGGSNRRRQGGVVTEITGTSRGANSIGQKSRSSNIDEIILRAYGEDKECQSDT